MQVDIERILPVTEGRDNFNKIVDEVEGSDHLYVLTKNGKPAAVVVGVHHLEKLTGETDQEVIAKVSQSNIIDTSKPNKPFVGASAPSAPTETPGQAAVDKEGTVENPFEMPSSPQNNQSAVEDQFATPPPNNQDQPPRANS